MFDSTQPFGASDLMRVSAFRRHLEDTVRDGDASAGATRMSALNPSLLQDLMRFDGSARAGEGIEVLEVMAAAVRHARPLLLQLQHEYRVIPLTLFPADRQVHCPLPVPQLLALRLTELRVLHVEPARLKPPGARGDVPEGVSAEYGPLGPVLWETALRGSRGELLPEIAGIAAYRVAPGAALAGLDLVGSLAAAVQRLRHQTANLREIATWPGFDRERAMRMLNGLYLHAALMVSRTHPAAINDDWQPPAR
ncbi:MAG: hypothetical protein KF683_26035 [Rubrivivax sp.]|nr:hypothetical protein [Rubrivivax sp.]